MDEQTRVEQVARASSGDPDALQALIVHYHAVLRGIVERDLADPFRRHIDPDDVLQEAYVAAFKAVAGCTFDGPGGFYKWLERIAQNQLADQQRALKRKKRDVGREISGHAGGTASYPDLVGRIAASQATPSRHLAEDEAKAAVISSLARLTDDQRSVIRMRFLEERPVAEVAAALGKTENAIHVICHRALSELRRLIGSITQFLSGL